MDKQLRALLEKLVAEKSLQGADLAYVSSLVAADHAGKTEEAKPLWCWIRRQILLHKNIFDIYLDSELDPILIDAGVEPESLRSHMMEPRRRAFVTYDGLKKAVRRNMTNERVGTRTHAARLVGLARIEEAVPLLVDSLESGREERQDWGMPVIAAGLEALAMLRHPNARKIAMKYVGHDDYMLRRSAQACALAGESMPEPHELKRIIESQYDPRLFVMFPEAFLAGAKQGVFTEQMLFDLLTQMYCDVETSHVVTRLVIEAGWKGAYQKLLAHDNRELRASAVLRVGWSKETWPQPLLKTRLEEEEDDQVKMTLIAVLGSLGLEDRAFLKTRLESADEWERLGAVWGTLGKSGYEVELEPRTKDESYQVRRAASTAQAFNASDPVDALIELKFTELLNEDHWWPWAVPLKGLQASGRRIPECARSFMFVSNDVGRLNDKLLDEALALYAHRPHQLLRWMGKDVPEMQRMRAVAFAGLSGGSVMQNALEQALLSAEAWYLAVEIALELYSVGGPRSAAATLKANLTIDDQARIEGEASLLPATCFAMFGDSELKKRATRALAKYGPEIEPYLSILLASPELEVSQTAAEITAQRPRAQDQMLADIARLMSSEVRRLGELEMRDRLVSCPSAKVRMTFAEVAGLPENPPEEVLPYLLQLAVDKDENVAAAALGSLAVKAGDAEWVKRLLLYETYSQRWRARERAVAAMSQIADPLFLPRLLELAAEEDHSVKENAVRALDRIAEKNPERGLIVLDIREPHRVRDRFGLQDRVNYDAEPHTEALRMLLLGLEKRRDAGEAQRHRGRKVMLTPAATGDEMIAAGARWSQKSFDALALYLKVTYTDSDSGSIIAEVGDDPSGEVLSALLQSQSVAATLVSWS
jgi:HEAT repeat protein